MVESLLDIAAVREMRGLPHSLAERVRRGAAVRPQDDAAARRVLCRRVRGALAAMPRAASPVAPEVADAIDVCSMHDREQRVVSHGSPDRPLRVCFSGFRRTRGQPDRSSTTLCDIKYIFLHHTHVPPSHT